MKTIPEKSLREKRPGNMANNETGTHWVLSLHGDDCLLPHLCIHSFKTSGQNNAKGVLMWERRRTNTRGEGHWLWKTGWLTVYSKDISKNYNNANGFLRGKKHCGETKFSLYVIRHLRNYFSYHIFVLLFSDFKGPICTLENVKNTHNFTIQR